MIKNITNKNLLLLLLIFFGFILRVITINSNPPAMHADEADTGYTALSLLKTGMDPYGNSWPLHFQDQALNYRAPLYTYSVIPFVYLLGLNPNSERLPSVIFGTLLIFVMYQLSILFFKNKSTALFVATVTAFNPWAIHLSRTGLEVMLSLLLTTSGILFFYLAKERKQMLILSSIAFSLSLFSYHPAKIFSPLIIFILVFLNYKFLLQSKKYVASSLLIFLGAIFVLGYLALFEKGASHLNDVSIFNPQIAAKSVDELRARTNAPLFVSNIFQNKPLYYLREFINSYIGPLSINYLFINGEGNIDKGTGSYGQFHFFDILPFLFGIVFLWKKNKKIMSLLLIWLFMGLVPAAVTRTGYYAYRDVNILAPLILIIGFGYSELLRFVVKKKRVMMSFSFATLFVLGLAYFIYLYYFSYPVYSRDWWGSSQKEALQYVNSEKINYDTVLVDGGFDWPVLYAFYSNIEPHEFQSQYGQFEKTKQMQFDNVIFGLFFNDKMEFEYKRGGTVLLITTPDKLKKIPENTFRAVDGNIITASYKLTY